MTYGNRQFPYSPQEAQRFLEEQTESYGAMTLPEGLPETSNWCSVTGPVVPEADKLPFAVRVGEHSSLNLMKNYVSSDKVEKEEKKVPEAQDPSKVQEVESFKDPPFD